MSKDGKHNKHRKNQAYLETLLQIFSALAFKQGSNNFVVFFFFPFSLSTKIPINIYVPRDTECNA